MNYYNINIQTLNKFEQQTGQSAYQFIDNLPMYERHMVLLLMNLEYERGHDDGEEDIDALMEEQYNRGYDDAMDEYTNSREDAYNEGYKQALQDAQDAILHIGR